MSWRRPETKPSDQTDRPQAAKNLCRRRRRLCDLGGIFEGTPRGCEAIHERDLRRNRGREKRYGKSSAVCRQERTGPRRCGRRISLSALYDRCDSDPAPFKERRHRPRRSNDGSVDSVCARDQTSRCRRTHSGAGARERNALQLLAAGDHFTCRLLVKPLTPLTPRVTRSARLRSRSRVYDTG